MSFLWPEFLWLLLMLPELSPVTVVLLLWLFLQQVVLLLIPVLVLMW